jgi:hypothetical protein
MAYHRTLITLAAVTQLFSVACGGGGDEDPNKNDPLSNEEIVRCDMPEDHACREYQRGQQGNATAFVDLPAARSSCAGGWPGGSPAPGVFSADSCNSEGALGRCVTQTHTLPRLNTVDYFYPEFGDTATAEDPLEPLRKLCAAVQQDAAAHDVDVTSTFEIPPF